MSPSFHLRRAPVRVRGGWTRGCWCTGAHMGVHPRLPSPAPLLSPQLFQGNWDAVTPAVQPLGRMVQARHVRILPRRFHNRIVLRAELLGCPPGTAARGGCRGLPPGARTPAPCPPLPLPKVPTAPLGVLPVTATVTAMPTPPPCGAGEFWCGDGCVGASRRCDGVADCAGGADEAGCEPPTTATPTHPARCPHCWGPLGACAPSGAGVWGAGPLTARLCFLQPPSPRQRRHPGADPAAASSPPDSGEPWGWGGGTRWGAGGGSG